ncbi:hypothetical protein MNVI_00070 [Mycobacterium noviomagense]|uniref:Uncharacterized protein n=1 Tax=Mycobacterium noviomagense TaxID=459858 RepID=A0A7I7P7Q0_9MYCO|nr:hypothetical protein MNVI_00070 [Mycobacterium noviomagense]
MLAQPLPAIGILGESHHRARYREWSRFQPAGEHAVAVEQDLVVGERAAVNGCLRERGDEVVLWTSPTLCKQLVEVHE